VAQQKHFLDSSVVRPYLFGGNIYRQYFRTRFGDDRIYISEYVRMEVIRGYLIPLLNFYFVLDMPHHATVSDAISETANSFKPREQKAVLQLTAHLYAARDVDLNDMRDKAKALRYLAGYIQRIELMLREGFTNIGVNATRCARCWANFGNAPAPDKEKLMHFFDLFQDKHSCRSNCRIDHFLVERHQEQVKQLITYAAGLAPRGSAANRGFLQTIEELKNALVSQAQNCSCDQCAKIGDVVIALEAPPDMQLEHTDHAFDHLCKVLDKPHKKHPPEQRVNRGET
jgi:hypothetical protein